MQDKREYLKKAEQNLYDCLKAGASSDEQIREKILKAISQIQASLEILGSREKNKYSHEGAEDDDMWVP
ncbi:MAG: hypothetical protein ACOCPN_02105 [Desulfonatronovibrionaceae bacterium]